MKIKNWLIAALLLSVVSCSKSDDTIDTQEKSLVDFLTQKQFDYVDMKGVYRYTLGTSAGSETVAEGDSIAFYYSGYQFNNSREYGFGAYFYGNIYEDAARDKFDTLAMKFTPDRIRVGHGNLAGLDKALPGVHCGDTVLIYMTSEYAYGQAGCYVVPKSKSVVFKVIIDSVWRR